MFVFVLSGLLGSSVLLFGKEIILHSHFIVEMIRRGDKMNWSRQIYRLLTRIIEERHLSEILGSNSSDNGQFDTCLSSHNSWIQRSYFIPNYLTKLEWRLIIYTQWHKSFNCRPDSVLKACFHEFHCCSTGDNSWFFRISISMVMGIHIIKKVLWKECINIRVTILTGKYFEYNVYIYKGQLY